MRDIRLNLSEGLALLLHDLVECLVHLVDLVQGAMDLGDLGGSLAEVLFLLF